MAFGFSIWVMATAMQTAEEHLSAHDPHLAPLIKKFGPCPLKPHTRFYQELVESIISQQLSIKAATAITQRFVALFNDTFPLPEQILAKTHEELRSTGLSNAKANYVRDLAQHIVDGKLEVNKLPKLSNQQVIQELTAVKGIGEWTAHIFLIFSLGRRDILPVGDLGIRTGMQKLYKIKTLPSPLEMQAIAQKYAWQPFESIACWYIWKSLEP